MHCFHLASGNFGEEAIHATVDVGVAQNLIASLEQPGHVGQSRHSGCEGKCCMRAFHARDQRFEGRPGGVARPSVVVVLKLVSARLDEGGGLVDRHAGGAVRIVGTGIVVDNCGGCRNAFGVLRLRVL